MTKVVFNHISSNIGHATPCKTYEEAIAKVEKMGGTIKVSYEEIPEERFNLPFGITVVSRSVYRA